MKFVDCWVSSFITEKNWKQEGSKAKGRANIYIASEIEPKTSRVASHGHELMEKKKFFYFLFFYCFLWLECQELVKVCSDNPFFGVMQWPVMSTPRKIWSSQEIPSQADFALLPFVGWRLLLSAASYYPFTLPTILVGDPSWLVTSECAWSCHCITLRPWSVNPKSLAREYEGLRQFCQLLRTFWFPRLRPVHLQPLSYFLTNSWHSGTGNFSI